MNSLEVVRTDRSGIIGIIKETAWRILDDQLVVFHPESGLFLILNQSAAFIWLLITEGKESEEVALEYSRTFKVELVKAEAEIVSLLNQWEEIVAKQKSLSSSVTEAGQAIKSTEIIYSFDEAEFPFEFSFNVQTLAFCMKFADQESYEWISGALCQFATTDECSRKFEFIVVKNDTGYEAYLEGQILGRALDRDLLFSTLLSKLNEIISTTVDSFCVLHASAVGRNELGIVFPGVKGQGKSTLAAALATRDYIFLNDDLVPLASKDSTIIPFPTRTLAKEGSWKALEPFYPTLSAEPVFTRNGQTLKRVLPKSRENCYPQIGRYRVNYIIFPAYLPSKETTLSPITRSEAFNRLHQGGFVFNPQNDKNLARQRFSQFIDVFEQASCFDLTFNSLTKAIDLIDKL